jgi:hypothetical protein
MPVCDDQEQLSTAHDTWVVDRRRARFRRLPRGVDPADPRLPAVWTRYHGAWRDPRTGALTLILDLAGTRLLRIGP